MRLAGQMWGKCLIRGAMVLGVLALFAGSCADPAWAKRDRGYWASETLYEGRTFDRIINFNDFSTGALLPPTVGRATDGKLYRYLSTTKAGWKFSKKFAMDMEVPYQVLHAEGFVGNGNAALSPNGALVRVDDTMSGLRDIVLKPRYFVSDPDAKGGGYNLEMVFRLNNGRYQLDPIEQQVMNFAFEGGIGFLSPFYSKGFGILLDNVWTQKWGKKRDAEYRLGYQWIGRYDPVTDLPTRTDPHDSIIASATYRVRPNPKERYQYQLYTSFYTDQTASNVRFDTLSTAGQVPIGGVLGLPGKARDLSKDPVVTAAFIWDKLLSRKLARRFDLSYTYTGAYDYFTTNAGVIRDLKMGDQYGTDLQFRYKKNRKDTFSYGAGMQRLERAKVSGISVADTERFQAFVSFGAERKLPSGYSYFASASVGLTSDTVDMVSIGTSYRW